MEVDQAQSLREMVSAAANEVPPSRSQHPAVSIAVASGKGGVGKSNVAINLAVCLSRRYRVIVLDADLGTANADVLCNLTPLRTVRDVMDGRCRLRDVILEAPGGFGLIAGASGLAATDGVSPYRRQRLIDQMYEIECEADLFIIDTGAGVNHNVLGFAMSTTQLMVVTTPEPTAMTDAYALIKMVAREDRQRDVRLLVNMVQHASEGAEVYRRLRIVCQKFLNLNLGHVGCIPFDPQLRAAVGQRLPLTLMNARSPASLALRRVAAVIERDIPKVRGRGVLRRMFSRLTG